MVLTGRRPEPLQAVAARLAVPGHVQPGDMTDAGDVERIAAAIKATLGRLDILVANAGVNIVERDWSNLTASGADALIEGNLSSAFYCSIAVLPIMRAQGGGVLIHTASMAGRFISGLSGAGYTAAKHGVVAMSHSINMQECIHGIRSSVVLPGEVETPILDKRPAPVSAEDRARMLRPSDVGGTDSVYRVPAGVGGDQRGDDRADLEQGVCGGAGEGAGPEVSIKQRHGLVGGGRPNGRGSRSTRLV